MRIVLNARTTTAASTSPRVDMMMMNPCEGCNDWEKCEADWCDDYFDFMEQKAADKKMTEDYRT